MKQWWINDDAEGDGTLSAHRTPWFGYIHVIEYSEYEKLKEENDKLIRLLNGETVELDCKKPGYSATIVLTESWDKKKMDIP